MMTDATNLCAIIKTQWSDMPWCWCRYQDAFSAIIWSSYILSWRFSTLLTLVCKSFWSASFLAKIFGDSDWICWRKFGPVEAKYLLLLNIFRVSFLFQIKSQHLLLSINSQTKFRLLKSNLSLRYVLLFTKMFKFWLGNNFDIVTILNLILSFF